ncbi:odorant receptor Or1-like [Ostrinia nubilalis]|uniref:odorant receptor Or1-like n=1 Tax=Ostrinia nubilalis TaxID=29057 RepID=UPI0030825199
MMKLPSRIRRSLKAKMIVKNSTTSVSMSLTALRLVGFWMPEHFGGNKRILYDCYGFFSFMFLLGTYLIIQAVDMCMIWGDLPLMTGVAFVLFTNLAQATKIFFMVWRRKQVLTIIRGADEVLRAVDSDEAKAIVKSCSRETTFLHIVYNCLTLVTMVGWGTSAEKNQLPLRAWYPYNTSKSPAYELTYMHQIGALCVAAFLNVCKDSLVTSLIAQCRCRLRLLGLSLRSLCKDLHASGKQYTAEQEAIVRARLCACVREHQAALEAAQQIQDVFSEQTFAQFNVSLVIICVTAFQLVSQTGNLVRLMSMGTYLVNMMYQVFLYCYQGNQLSEESAMIAGSAYECPWYLMSISLRRSLLIVMIRTRRISKITAGGFTTLSLASFMAIIKASYSLFTLLQQVEGKK